MADFSVAGLTSVINRLLPEPHAGLLAGLLFGTKTSLPPDLYEALVISGTLHIVALSGMNITILEDLLAYILSPVVGKRSGSLITIGILLWFVWFVGPSPPVVRAAIMGSISLLSVVFGRQYFALLSWGIALSVMLLINPANLQDVSFQLSAFATLGIILFARTAGAMRRKEDRSVSRNGSHIILRIGAVVWHMMKTNVRLTLSAQVFTVPLVFFYFRRVSIIAPVANVAVGWVIAPVTMLGWAACIAGWLVLYGGQMVAWFAWVLLEYLIRTVYFCSRLPFAGFAW